METSILTKKGVNHHQNSRESDFDKLVVSGIMNKGCI